MKSEKNLVGVTMISVQCGWIASPLSLPNGRERRDGVRDTREREREDTENGNKRDDIIS